MLKRLFQTGRGQRVPDAASLALNLSFVLHEVKSMLELADGSLVFAGLDQPSHLPRPTRRPRLFRLANQETEPVPF